MEGGAATPTARDSPQGHLKFMGLDLISTGKLWEAQRGHQKEHNKTIHTYLYRSHTHVKKPRAGTIPTKQLWEVYFVLNPSFNVPVGKKRTAKITSLPHYIDALHTCAAHSS